MFWGNRLKFIREKRNEYKKEKSYRTDVPPTNNPLKHIKYYTTKRSNKISNTKCLITPFFPIPVCTKNQIIAK